MITKAKEKLYYDFLDEQGFDVGERAIAMQLLNCAILDREIRIDNKLVEAIAYETDCDEADVEKVIEHFIQEDILVPMDTDEDGFEVCWFSLDILMLTEFADRDLVLNIRKYAFERKFVHFCHRNDG